MRELLLILSIICTINCMGQSVVMRDTASRNIDSLLKRIDKLERNQSIMVANSHSAGNQIMNGAITLGIGTAATIGGGLLLSFSHSISNGNGGVRLSNGQIGGLLLSTAGVGLNIAGLAMIGQGGKKMKDL